MSNIDYKLELRTQLVKFLDELIQQFPKESNFVIIRIYIKDQLTVDNVMNRFLKYMYIHKDKVKNRDILHPRRSVFDLSSPAA